MNRKHLIERFKPLIKTSSIYAGANLLIRAMPFLMLPVLTRYLSPADYGVIAVYSLIQDGIWPLTSMSTSGAVGRAYYDRDKKDFDFPCYISSALFVNFALFLAMGVLIFCLKGYIYEKLNFPPLWLMAVPLITCAASFADMRAKLWVFQSKPLQFGFFNVSQMAFNMTLSVLLVVIFSMDWRGRIIGIGMSEILFSITAVILLIKEYKIRFSLKREYVKDVLKFGIPLVPYSIGTLIITGSDKYFLKTMEGLPILGIYIVGYSMGQIIIFIASAIDTSVSPKIYNRLGQFKEEVAEELVRYIYMYMIFLVIIAVLVTFAAPYILRFWVGRDFQAASQFVLWICFGNVAFALYRVFSQFIQYSKKTYLLTLSALITAPLTVLANYVLIKLNGPVGAAQGVFAGYTIFCLLTWGFVQKLYPMPWLKIFWRGKGSVAS